MQVFAVQGPRRRAFTLVELLVVIAIIGVLVAMLLPAVQAAREAARRSSCSNKLKQLALGLHNYHDVYKKFPPDAIWFGNPKGTTAASGQQRNYTWITMILPFIEQTTLHSQINFSQPAMPQMNNILVNGNPAVSLQLEVLLCPSDYEWDEAPRGFGVTSYAGNAGWDGHRRKYGDINRAGVFPLLDPVKISDISDGTSNTLMLGEVTTRGYVKPSAPHRSVGGAGNLRSTQSSVSRSAFVATGAWHGWNHAWVTAAGKGNVLMADGVSNIIWGQYTAPNHISPPVYYWHHAMNNDWPGPGSLHPGGAQFALADASVRFIPETISVGQAALGGNDESTGQNGNVWAALHNIQAFSTDVVPTLP